MTTPQLSDRALDLLRVIHVQHRNFGWCDDASLCRALPHDPAWIEEDIDTLHKAGLIAFAVVPVGGPRGVDDVVVYTPTEEL